MWILAGYNSISHSYLYVQRKKRTNIDLKIDVFFIYRKLQFDVWGQRWILRVFEGKRYIGFHLSRLPRQFSAWILHYITYECWYSVQFKSFSLTCYSFLRTIGKLRISYLLLAFQLHQCIGAAILDFLTMHVVFMLQTTKKAKMFAYCS